MPRSFFDQVLVSPARRRSRPWVTIGSIVLHTLGLVALFVWPLLADVRLPDVHSALPAMMLASAELPPPPPEVAAPPPASAPAVNPDAAPITSPDEILPEVERPAVSTIPPIPGGIPGAGSASAFTSLLGGQGRGTGLAPPPPVPPAPRRVGGEIEAPVRVVYKAPVYPQVAVSARMEGMVILEATIDPQGIVQNVTVLRSMPLLDQAAVDAVKQWRYTPTRLNGQAIPVIMTVTVTFTLR